MPVVTKVRDSQSSSAAFSSEIGLHRSFWAAPRHPYYIFCPDYRENSAGVLALHFLCHSLNLIGFEAYVTAQSVSPRLRTPQLTPTIERVHMSGRNMPVTIYPEVVTGNPRNAPVVVRYLLNSPGHLAGEKTFARGEILFTHRQQFVPSSMRARSLWIPVSDLSVFNPFNVDPGQRKGSCFYANRYLERGGKLMDLTNGSMELSQKNPRSLRELASILRQSRMLYSYEPSALCTQAMLCGCPVAYIPNDYMTEFPAADILGRDGAAWGSSAEEIQRAEATVKNIYPAYEAMARGFDAQLKQFIEITQRAADEESAFRYPPV